MAQRLVKRYFNNRAYFRLLGSQTVDNPDQRISEDVRIFTVSSLSFLLILLNSLVTLVAFIGVLWVVSGMLVVAPMYMRGQVEFGVVTQAVGAFAAVLAAFSLIIYAPFFTMIFTAGITTGTVVVLRVGGLEFS